MKWSWLEGYAAIQKRSRTNHLCCSNLPASLDQANGFPFSSIRNARYALKYLGVHHSTSFLGNSWRFEERMGMG